MEAGLEGFMKDNNNSKKLKSIFEKWLRIKLTKLELFLLWLSAMAFGSGFLIMVLFLTFLVIHNYALPFDNISLENSAWFGDYFGGVIGSLWALSGVILFFLAITFQRKELILQRKQLKLQHEEFKNQIIELRETKEIFEFQKFENTFFNLLRNQQEILNNVSYTYEVSGQKRLYTGRNFFSTASKYLRNIYRYINPDQQIDIFKFQNFLEENHIYINMDRLIKMKNELPKDAHEDKIVIMAYKIFFWLFYDQVGHYFRHLYNILKYLKSQESVISQFKFPLEYASIIQSQMSASELFLTFYDGLYFHKMHKLLNHYDFMENLAIEDLLSNSHQLYYKVRMKSKIEETPDKILGR